MKKLQSLFIVLAFLTGMFVQSAKADVSVTVTNPTNATPALSASYTSLANAITALSGITAISGPVTLTCASSGAETAPAGGYAISFTAATTLANNVVIDGNGSTITASAALTAGNLNDAIFKIIGSDYVTLKNFTMLENAANTTNTPAASNNMTEWGVALLYASATNGAQNNTIQNNTITLNRTYANTFGIYSNTRHSATDVLTAAEVTSAAGSNSGNKVYGNNISNVNFGIVFIGAGTTLAAIDNGNDIGGSSVSTGNTISNFGGGASLSAYVSLTGNNYAIFDNQQINDNVSYNTITSASGLPMATITIGGILKNYSVAQPAAGTVTTTNLNYNTVTIASSPTTGGIIGVNSQGIATALSTATINMNNNSVINCAIQGASATTASITGVTNLSWAGVVAMNYNIITGNSSTATTSGSFTGIANSGTIVTSLNIDNNQIGNSSSGAYTLSAAASGQVVGINNTGGGTGSTLSISSNNFQGFVYSVASSGLFRCISTSVQVLTETISANNFNNITINSSASNGGFLIYASSATPTVNITGNYVTTQWSNTNATGNVNNMAVYNAGTSASGTSTISGNTFSNISFKTTTSFGAVVYWNVGNVAGTTHNTIFDNNIISNVSNTGIGAAAQAANLYGILIGYGNANVISNNQVNNLTAAGGTTIGIFGGAVSTNAAGNLTIRNNVIHDIKTTSVYGTAAGGAQGIQLQAGPAANYIYKNKIYDISCVTASAYTGGTATGMTISQATATSVTNIHNNYIGRIYAVNSTYFQSVVGIFHLNSVANTTNVYYNTINLDGTAGGQSYCYYKNSATSKVDLRNNIFTNNATPGNGDEQMVYFFTGALSATYLTTSNNNIVYAGTPDLLHLIYADGAVNALTNLQQTLSSFLSFVGPTRESITKTESVTYLNTATGSGSDFLHINPTVGTQVESGAANIATYTTDYDGDIRQGNAGYTGTGTAPDVGADEGQFTFVAPMVYTSATTTQNVFNTAPNVTNQQIIGIQVVTTGVASPFVVSSFTVNANGTTNIADITNAHIYYTGNSPIFAATGLFGTVASPTIANFNVTGSQSLSSGTNYFWLTFDIQSGATINNVVDAECSQIVGSGSMGTKIPSVTAPFGSRAIKGPLNGTYTIGLTDFNKATGQNITFQKVVKNVSKVVKQGVLENSALQNNTRNNAANVVAEVKDNTSASNEVVDAIGSVQTISSRKTMATGEETSWVPMQNGAVYYGPLGSGTQNSSSHAPSAGVYATITAAISDLNTRGVDGPVTFLLDDPSYTTGETFPIVVNVTNTNVPTATNTVTLKPNTGVTSTISGSASSILNLYGADYFTLDGSNNGTTSKNLTVENTSVVTTSIVIWNGSASATNGATYNTFKNLIVKGSGATTTFTGIVSSSGSTVGGVAEAANSNLTIQNNTIIKCLYGIATVGPTANETGLLITGNTVGSTVSGEKLGFKGIAVYQQASSTISDNTIIGIENTNTGTTSGIYVAGTANGINILRNKISDIKNVNTGGWGSNGIELISSSAAANVLVANNVIYDVTGYGYTGGDAADNGYGIVVASGDGYKIYYNSVSMNVNQNADGYPAAFNVLAAVTTAGGIDLRNNIFSNSQTVGTDRYAIYSGAANTVFTAIDYNDYYTTGPDLGFLTSNLTNLAAIQTGFGGNTHSISANPSFTSSTNLNPLAGSPVIGVAVPLPGVVDFDILNIARSITAPTLGAYEGASSKTLNLTSVLLQGLYAGGGLLNPAQDETGNHWGAGVADHITVELHDAASYATIHYTVADVALSTSGSATVTVPGTYSASYYITVKHRNSLETVSATAVSFAGSTMTQSFGTPADVFGGNLVAMIDANYAIWAGDVSQDGLVDGSDMAPVDNQAAAFAAGYIVEDCNGDGLIDGSDLAIVDNNASAFVGVATP